MNSLVVHLLVTSPRGSCGSMARHADLVELALRRHAPALDVRRHDLAPDPGSLSRYPDFVRRRLHHLMVDRNARLVASRAMGDVFHVLDGSHAYLSRHFQPSRLVVTCHDLIPGRMAAGQLGPRPRWPARLLIRRSMAGLRTASTVLADSTPSARDATEIADVLPSRVRVLPVPLDPSWRQWLTQPRSAASLVDPYVLHLGHDGPYKNRRGVWNIFRRLAPDWPGRLVVAGQACSPALAAEISASGLGHRVSFVASPSESELLVLYRGASLLLFPSLFEGFGWPPLEALACGCPVVASDVGGLREVLGDDSPCLFDPADEKGMAAAALSVLTDPQRADAWVASGRARVGACTLDRFAAGLVETYERVASSRSEP